MRADLHVHSSYSEDGKQTVEQLLSRCIELGMGAVAITDHNTMSAYDDIEHLAKHNIIVIPAAEITTTEGHILALGIEDTVPRGLSAADTLEKIHQGGGIAVAPHPYRMWSGVGEEVVRRNRFDAIEVINGRSRKRANSRAEQLASSLGLPQVGGSDAHNNRSLGRVYTEVPDSCRTWKEIVEAVRSGHCSAIGEDLSRSSSLTHGAMTFSGWLRRGFRRM